MVVEKKCSVCRKVLAAANFGPDKRKATGLRSECKSCRKVHYGNNAKTIIQYQKKYYQANKGKVKDRILRKEFGLGLSEYKRMLSKQNGVCKICGAPPKCRALAVDHCHTSGRIRGLLCASCNRGISYFKDSPDLLKSAAHYLGAV